METTSDHDPETELMNKLDEAIRGYGDIARHIADNFPYLSVSKPIQTLLTRLPDNYCEEFEILQKVANLYRRVEDEIRSYMGSVKNFAQENISAVEGVKRQKYKPEEALINFEESLEHLKRSFARVLERHREAPENLKHRLEETDTTGLLKMMKSQSPSDPTQANPWAFAKHAHKTAATMGRKVMPCITAGAAFLYGAMSYVLSKQGNFAKEHDVLKNDLENVLKALQCTDQILDGHKRVLEEASTRATGISARFENIEMLQLRQSRLHRAVDEIYQVSSFLKAVAIQHVP